MICIIDYGMGNLRSVQKALERVGAQAIVSESPTDIEHSESLVLPGVGAFGDAMRNLHATGLIQPLLDSIEGGKPLLGICLGMQLLFQESEELGIHTGLGVLSGRVRSFPFADPARNGRDLCKPRLKVPHIGWNQIHIQRFHPLLGNVADGSFAYFVHSYYVEPTDRSLVLADTDYGVDFASVVGRDNVMGIQFHPEKSQRVGLQILTNFAAGVRNPQLDHSESPTTR